MLALASSAGGLRREVKLIDRAGPLSAKFPKVAPLLMRQARPSYLPASWPAFGREPNVLPKRCNCLRPKNIGFPRGGFEPPTFRLTAESSETLPDPLPRFLAASHPLVPKE